MKYPIRIVKRCKVRIEGQVRSFERDEEIEVSKEEGRDLIRRGLAVPGRQHTVGIPIGR